jgi:Eukaryotic aspartyl protease
MYKQGLVSPTFSLAIQRGTSGGYLALGGLPPVDVDQNSFVSTPIQVLQLSGFPQNTYTFYTIDVDAYVYGSKKSSSSQAIVDSGTTLVYLPSSVAKAVNAAFSPKAKLLSNQGAYFVNCQAKAPTFGVTINGTTFSVSAQDLIFQDQVDPTTGLCLTGVQDGGSGPYILGDVFMRNVVAVFDVGAAQMSFAPHSY